MSTLTPDPLAPAPIERQGIRLGDVLFKGVAGFAALGVAGILVFLTYKIFVLAWPAIEKFGASFIWTQAWNPTTNVYGALVFIYGTLVTSFIALLLATPLSIAIALFLTELAPKRLAAPIATMVELLAAIPSVVLGLWGILVFGPWVAQHLEPWLNSWFGFLPIFSGDPSQSGVLPAALVLTIMIIPITSAICRELFSRVPRGSLRRLARPRLDAVGGDPQGRDPVRGARHFRRGSARARPRVRRGDRRHPGDRRRQLDQPLAVPAGRHAREPDREHLPGRRLESRGAVAALPRRHPARDLADHERLRAADRQQVPEGTEDVDRMSTPEVIDPYDITVPVEQPRQAAR